MKVLSAFALALSIFSSSAFAENVRDFNLWTFDGNQNKADLVGDPREPVPPGINIVELVTLSSDQNSNTTTINLMVDSNQEVAGMYNLPNPKNIKDDETKAKNVYWLNDIESAGGSVMLIRRGRNALIMQGALDRGTQEGRFNLKYLINGIFMTYDSCELLLKKKDNSWFVENAYSGEPVNVIKVITHPLGITTLEGLCPEELILN